MSAKKHTYLPETAGAICETKIAVVPSGSRLDGVRKALREKGIEYDTVDYIYVSDDSGALIGLLSLRHVLLHASDTVVDELMEREIVSISPDADQEHIVGLALKHDLKSVPVVENGRLLGVVPPHKILQILHDENVEDLLKEAGVVQRSLSGNTTIGKQIKGRLPWLLFGTMGGLLAALVVHRFESALAEQLMLAAFIPTIVYLADAVGSQVQTIYVRAYAFGLSRQLGTTLPRELMVVSSVGVLVSLVLAGIIMMWLNQPVLALIVSVAALISIIFAGIVAVIMPWLFIKLKYDPAVSSGPLGTIVRDVGSIMVYFLVAEYALARFGS